EGAKGAVPLAMATALVLALSLNDAREVHAFERDEVGHFDDLLQKMPKGSRLLMLNLEPHSSRVNADVFNFFGSYYRARYGCISAFSFSEIPHWPLRYRREWKPTIPLTWGAPCAFRNERDGDFFEFVMVHGQTDPFAAAPPGPVWEVIGASRAW